MQHYNGTNEWKRREWTYETMYTIPTYTNNCCIVLRMYAQCEICDVRLLWKLRP